MHAVHVIATQERNVMEPRVATDSRTQRLRTRMSRSKNMSGGNVNTAGNDRNVHAVFRELFEQCCISP